MIQVKDVFCRVDGALLKFAAEIISLDWRVIQPIRGDVKKFEKGGVVAISPRNRRFYPSCKSVSHCRFVA